jgi:antitoxin MazE
MAALTRIGNSQGIRIPKPIIEQAKLEGVEIELEVTPEGLLLRPVRTPSRAGWSDNIQAVQTAHRTHHDEGILHEWLDEPLDDWEW